MKQRRTSLALRISALAVGIALITALTGGLIAVRLVHQASESGARQTLARLADEVQGDLSSTPLRTAAALRALKVDVGIVNALGRVTSTNQLARDALTTSQIRTVLAGASVSAVQTVDGTATLVEARPAASGGFVMVQPRSAATAIANRTVRRLFVALAIACGIAVLLGLLVSWRLALPLRRTAAAAHALADGRRDVTVEPGGPAEVAEVADALNTLGSNLARSESRQREFLLSVSHDLRTPLTAITGYAESLADGIIDPSQVQRVGGVMVAEARRLERFVGDLLDLARLDAREVRIDVADVDLVTLIDAAGAVWSSRCEAEGVPLQIERPPGPLQVSTDQARVRQVLDGLLENALRVVPSGQPIVLASRGEYGHDGRRVAVAEVRDGGPGLTDDDIAVAFDRSVLYERYRGIRQVGTGLGLAIVHQLVARLGGTIEAGHAAEGGSALYSAASGGLIGLAFFGAGKRNLSDSGGRGGVQR